jgi:eukaryotic-like serine/threonine-protein kinase
VPRKNGFAVLTIAVVIACVGPWFLLLKRPPVPPSVSASRQITHDGLVKTNLASDGSILYFTEISGESSIISKVPIAGGDVSRFLSAFPSVQLLDVSTTHSSLLAAETGVGPSSENPFWVYPLQGGPAKRFGNLTGQEAVWAPDGQRVLLVKGSSLYITAANGGPAKELANVDGTPYFPRFSPDGQRIRFSVGNISQNTSSIWEVNGNGSGLHALLPDWHDVSSKCCGSWTADGHYYIFQATENAMGSNGNLFALAESTDRSGRKTYEKPVRLTEGAISFSRPVLAADSKKLWTLGLNIRGAVVKYEPKSGKYVPFLSGISASDLDFSADRQWVTYISIPEGTLWRCRTDGSERQQLTFPPGRAALPRWSPDAKQIAYINVQPGQPWAIFIVPAEGGASRRLVSEKLTQIDVNWSNNGDKIIFGRITQHTADGLSIVAYDLKSRELSTIPGSEGLFSPRVSPDGRFIAAITGDLTKLKLYDTRTQKWSEWQTLESGAVNYPVWSSDSESIYFDDLVSGEGAYCRAKVGENHYEQVFLQTGIERYLGPFGPWSGRAPDGSVLFVQEASAREIYELRLDLP